jgi:hypothetical protein
MATVDELFALRDYLLAMSVPVRRADTGIYISAIPNTEVFLAFDDIISREAKRG